MTDTGDRVTAKHCTLLRRVHPEQLVPDGESGALRASSAAFKDLEMSVDNETMMSEAGLDASWSVSMEKHHGWPLLRFPSAAAIECGQTVEHKPLLEDPGRLGEPNPYHTEVRGKKTGRVVNALKQAYSWAVPPKQNSEL